MSRSSTLVEILFVFVFVFLVDLGDGSFSANWLWCGNATQQLLDKLVCQFPAHGLMDSFKIVYTLFWLQSGAEASFYKHFDHTGG